MRGHPTWDDEPKDTIVTSVRSLVNSCDSLMRHTMASLELTWAPGTASSTVDVLYVLHV